MLYKPNTPLRIEEFELPDSARSMSRLAASGVCHSDWHIVKGEWPQIPIPSILGHEGAGIVEAVGGAVRGIAEGDHVVLSWKRNCDLGDRPGDALRSRSGCLLQLQA